MVTDGFDTDTFGQAADANQPDENDNVNKSGEYSSVSGEQPCPPGEDDADKNASGEYGNISSESICPPKLADAEKNASGEYEGNQGSGNIPTPHPEECDCEDCCFYSEGDPNTIALGGHELEEIYNKVSMKQMWYQLLHPYLYPSIDLSIQKTILEVGESLGNVNFGWATANDQNAKPLNTELLRYTGLGLWILETGNWDGNGRWKADGIWK